MNIPFVVLLMLFALSFPLSAQESNVGESNGRLLKVTLAKADGDGNIVEDPTEFKASDIPIYCYVDLNDDEPASLKVRYVAVKAKGLRPNSVIVTLQHKTAKGETGASFNASPKGTWAVGDYVVEVYIDGKLVEKREFQISS